MKKRIGFLSIAIILLFCINVWALPPPTPFSRANYSTSFPATCSTGQLYIDTDDGTGTLWLCNPANTWVSILGFNLATPGTSGNIAKSDGTNWISSNSITGITIGGFTASKALCSDGSGNAVACTNLTDLAFSSYVAKADTIRLVTFAWDGGGSTLSTGVGTKVCTTIPHAGTINGWHLTIDTSGAIVVYVFKDVWSTSAVPTTAIDASEHPTIVASAVGATGSAVGWTTSVTAYDNICAYIFSVTSATRANLVIHGTR